MPRPPTPSWRATCARCSAGERDLIANAANTAALIYDALPDLNWAGFYLYKSGELVLGPFQGKPACVRIAIGKGVCGTAAARRDNRAGRGRARVPRPHRLRFGFELRNRDAAVARRGAARRARPRQPEACALRRRSMRAGSKRSRRSSSTRWADMKRPAMPASVVTSCDSVLAARDVFARCACRCAALRLR